MDSSSSPSDTRSPCLQTSLSANAVGGARISSVKVRPSVGIIGTRVCAPSRNGISRVLILIQIMMKYLLVEEVFVQRCLGILLMRQCCLPSSCLHAANPSFPPPNLLFEYTTENRLRSPWGFCRNSRRFKVNSRGLQRLAGFNQRPTRGRICSWHPCCTPPSGRRSRRRRRRRRRPRDLQ